jgi:DNA-binding transcriptional MocR family regulator
MTHGKTAWSPRYADRMQGVQASEIRELLKLIDQPDVISFAGGIPDPALFPIDRIREAYDAILTCDKAARRALQYSISEGDPELRAWIAEHMREKGVACGPDNILITSGSQQALEFLGRLFISPGDTVAVTAPTYLGALQAFASNQPHYKTLHISDNGCVDFNCGNGERAARCSGFVYVVPDFANPTGETLGNEARRGILALAKEKGMPVIEDSPYEVLRFDGIAEPPMLALDIRDVGSIDASRVIYCGSFSKIFTPGLRVGWVCAAREIVSRLTLVKQSADLNSPAINQQVTLHLARTSYDAQAERARLVYRVKRDAMLSGLVDTMPPGSRWSRPDGGMFIWVELPADVDTKRMLGRAVEDHGVAFVPGGAFFADGSGGNTLRLNYTLPSLVEIEIGLGRLSDAIASGGSRQ